MEWIDYSVAVSWQSGQKNALSKILANLWQGVGGE
jgi:hypothetical protein